MSTGNFLVEENKKTSNIRLKFSARWSYVPIVQMSFLQINYKHLPFYHHSLPFFLPNLKTFFPQKRKHIMSITQYSPQNTSSSTLHAYFRLLFFQKTPFPVAVRLLNTCYWLKADRHKQEPSLRCSFLIFIITKHFALHKCGSR